jgi:hypothetical protein
MNCGIREAQHQDVLDIARQSLRHENCDHHVIIITIRSQCDQDHDYDHDENHEKD